MAAPATVEKRSPSSPIISCPNRADRMRMPTPDKPLKITIALLCLRQPTKRLRKLNGTTAQISQIWKASSPIKNPPMAGKTDKITGKARQCRAQIPEVDIATLSAQPTKSKFNTVLISRTSPPKILQPRQVYIEHNPDTI